MKLEELIQSNKFVSEVQKANLNVMATASWIKGQINSRFKPYGITHEQFNVMRILKGKHPLPMNMGDIGSRMLDKCSNVTRIVEKLEDKDLARRYQSPSDKRENLVEITNKGLALLDKIDQEVLSKAEHIHKALTELEAQMLNALLEKLRTVQF